MKRNYIFKKNKVSKDEIEKIRIEKLELFSLFEAKSFKMTKNKLNEILTEINGYSEIIQSIIINSLRPYFKTFFAFLEDEKYRTNIEQNRKKCLSKKPFLKSVKKLMKIKTSAMSRINIRREIQNQKKLFNTQTPSF